VIRSNFAARPDAPAHQDAVSRDAIRMHATHPRPARNRIRRWPRRVLITAAAVLVVLVAARIALPFVVQRFVNQRLAGVPGYVGSVGDIDIGLLRGAYRLEDVAIHKHTDAVREPFFLAREIDFSLAWRELFRGKVVSDILVRDAELNFVGAREVVDPRDLDREWQEVIRDLFPIDITHFELARGTVRYLDVTREPPINVFITELHATATGLRNRPGENGEDYPAEIRLEGVSVGGGRVQLSAVAEPLAGHPRFHLTAKIDDMDLTALNDELRAYANVDVSRGTFRLAAEMAAKDGGFQGYVKPFFEDLEFDDLEDREKGVLTRVWENIVAGLAWLVKNKSRDQVGTRIPFQGRFGDPDVGMWTTITNLFRHGFVRAFNPTIEGSLDPEQVLPTGESADGVDVADKGEGAAGGVNGDRNRAGAPTGQAADPRK
jgi:hypothetical protein